MKFYNSAAWRTTSEHYRRNHPTCEVCEHAGKVTAARVTDHIVPINECGARLDKFNLMAMCSQCHDRKSGMEAHKGCIVLAVTQCDGYRVPRARMEVCEILNENSAGIGG